MLALPARHVIHCFYPAYESALKTTNYIADISYWISVQDPFSENQIYLAGEVFILNKNHDSHSNYLYLLFIPC